jgi:zinc protease
MKLLSLTALLALGMSSTALAADSRPAKPEMKVNVPPYSLNTNVYTFPSGLRIMMQSDRTYPTVGVFSVVNHGSADDPKDLAEVAHFVEHTWFRSVHGELPPVMDVIQDVGTVFNATTHNDWTDYQTYAASKYVNQLLTLESLRLTEPYIGVTEEQITVEREVIRNEWRRRNEQNFALFANYMNEVVYPEDHGYHTSSTHDTIDNIKLKNLQDFFDQYYTPEETTVFVVGDIPEDPNEQLSLVFRNFAPELLHPEMTDDDIFEYPRPGIENPDPDNPDHVLTGAWDPADRDTPPESRKLFPLVPNSEWEPRISEDRPPVPDVGTTEMRTKQWPLDEKMVVVGWSLPGGYRSDHWALQLLGNVASGFVYSGFAEDVDRKRIGEVACGSWAEITNTTFFCYAELKDKKLDPERVRTQIIDQLSQIWNPEMAQSNMVNGYARQLSRARNELLANTLKNVDAYVAISAGRANDTAVHAHYTGEPKFYSDGMNQIMNFDGETIIDIASTYLKRDRAAAVVLEPLSEDEIDTTSEFSSYSGANQNDVVINSSDDLSAVDDEQIEREYIQPDLSDLEDFTLDNGLRVVIKPHGAAPLTRVNLFVKRNFYDEPEGLASFVRSFTQSVGNDPLPIAATNNFYIQQGWPGYPGHGAPFALDPGYSSDSSYNFSYMGPSGNIDGLLWLLREEMETVKPYIDGKSTYITRVEKSLKGDWFDPEWHLSRISNEYMYPGHPAGQVRTWDDVQAMREWGNGDIDAYLTQILRPENAVLVVSGNFDPKKTKELVTKYWGGWKGRGDAEPIADMTPPAMPDQPSRIVILDEPGRTQSQVNTSCRLNYDDPSLEPAVRVLGSLLRNQTFSTLRIAEGLAYSPGAYAAVRGHNGAELGFYSLATNVGVGRTVEFFKEAVEKVESGDVDLDEVKLHKLRNARAAGVRRQSIDQMTDALLGVLRRDADWDLLTDGGKHIAGVNPDQLTDLVKGCSEHMVTTIQGPKDVITPQLDERGYEYEVLEWQSYAEELLWQHDAKAAKKREKDKQKKAKKDAKKADKADNKKDDGDDGEANAD